MTGQSSSQAATPIQWWKPALFFLVVIAGLWYVKWQPYYGKAFTAAETHSIGKSILAQADANPWQAALDYAMIYFLAVWKAAVLGVILGSLIQVLIPRDWLLRTLGQSRFRGTLLGTLFSLPGMMCTCCAAPVAAGMRRQQVSMGGALKALGLERLPDLQNLMMSELEKAAAAHGIERRLMDCDRKHLDVPEYQQAMRDYNELTDRIEQKRSRVAELDRDIEGKERTVARLDRSIETKTKRLASELDGRFN